MLNRLQRALQSLRKKGSILTRRSAGLPSLLVGIVTAGPTNQIFKTAFHDLLEESRKEVASRDTYDQQQLPQVHAMNCLTSLFKDTRLGEYSESFVKEALELAASRLESHR